MTSNNTREYLKFIELIEKLVFSSNDLNNVFLVAGTTPNQKPKFEIPDTKPLFPVVT